MSSPTQRSLARLRKQGYRAQVVERWVPQARRRIDLFSCIDVVGIGHGHTVGVQATSASNLSSRVAKMRAAEALPDLLAAGWRCVVWGWRKSKRSGRWECREVEVRDA